jgi:hypothetical protein
MNTLAQKEAKARLVQEQIVNRPVVHLLKLVIQLMGRGGRHVTSESRAETLHEAKAKLNKMTGNNG